MITTFLEQEVLKGNARWENLIHGGGGRFDFPLAQNKIMIITDVVIMPFIDNPLDSTIATRINNTVYSLKLRSEHSEDVFAFRLGLANVNGQGAAMTRNFTHVPITLNVYSIHRALFTSELLRVPPPPIWVTIATTVLTGDPKPLGYRNEQNLSYQQLNVTAGSLDWYSKQDGTANAAGIRINNKWCPSLDTGITTLESMNNLANCSNDCYPIINYHVLLMDSGRFNELKGSK
jgi:hypothetical protein